MSQYQKFGKYLLLEKVASGGMAEVFLTRQGGANGVNKLVAIKRILPQYSENPEFIEMFKEEAKIAVNLNHSNVVSIYDFGIERGQFYLVMEFVEGQNLRQVLNHLKKENKEFSAEQIIYIVKEVASGLDHAHRCLDSETGRPLNITHRDMSPQNVMISFEGEVKIVDFGIAKTETQVEQTRAGTIKGKFGYMSPEQAEGLQLDSRTDVFSLGIVLWELLAKDRLFTAPNEGETLRKVRDCQIPSLRKINPTISAELERICNKALAKDKSIRYQSAAAFHKDLNRFLNTQYPDFAAQDFSKSMKSLFNRMYLENRRKFAEFMKVQIVDEEATTVTQTSTLTASTSKNDSQQEQGVSSHSQSVDLEALKSNTNTNSKSLIQQKLLNQQTRTYSNTRTNVSQTNTGFVVRRTETVMNSSWLMYVGAAAVVVSASLFFYKAKFGGSSTEKVQVAYEPVEERVEPSKAKVPLNIQSEPSGAIVYVNGERKGITPYRGSIEAGKQFSVTLSKEEYLPYDRPTERSSLEGYVLKAALQPKPPMGYISIEVTNGSPETIIYVNNQRLLEKAPIARYQIAADLPVKIKAVNPYSKLTAEQEVTVGVGQKKAVRLIMTRQPASN